MTVRRGVAQRNTPCSGRTGQLMSEMGALDDEAAAFVCRESAKLVYWAQVGLAALGSAQVHVFLDQVCQLSFL